MAQFEMALGATPGDVRLGPLLDIPAQDLLEAMRASGPDGRPLFSPMQRGALSGFLRTAAAAVGRTAPALGSAAPDASALAPTGMRKLSSVLDATLDSEVKPMASGDVRDLFDSFDAAQGGLPRPSEEPTEAQIAGLAAVLRADASPYADFALFGPFGRRQAKMLKFTAMVWVDGQLVPKLLDGPPSFGAWRRCWRVYRTTMLLLRASPPGPLDDYEERIRQLNEAYGASFWGLIARADDVMRSECWERIRRRVEQELRAGTYRGRWYPGQPWAAVMRESAEDRSYWDIGTTMSRSSQSWPAYRSQAGAR